MGYEPRAGGGGGESRVFSCKMVGMLVVSLRGVKHGLGVQDETN